MAAVFMVQSHPRCLRSLWQVMCRKAAYWVRAAELNGLCLNGHSGHPGTRSLFVQNLWHLCLQRKSNEMLQTYTTTKSWDLLLPPEGLE